MEHKNPFGKRNGKIITINDLDQYENGLKCDCRCPVCDGTFVARMGEIRSWHFAHSGEPCDASKQIINGSYQLVRQFLMEKGYFCFPGLYAFCDFFQINTSYFSRYVVSSHEKKGYTELFGSGTMSVKSVEMIYNNGGISTALVINGLLAVRLSIETEYCIEKSVGRYENMATLCIDINDSIYRENSEELSRIIIDGVDNKEWIYSPRISKWLEPLENERIKKHNEYVEQKRLLEERQKKEAEEKRKQYELKRQKEIEESKKAAMQTSLNPTGNKEIHIPKKKHSEYKQPEMKYCCICRKKYYPDDCMWGKNTRKYYCHGCVEENSLNWKEL